MKYIVGLIFALAWLGSEVSHAIEEKEATNDFKEMDMLCNKAVSLCKEFVRERDSVIKLLDDLQGKERYFLITVQYQTNSKIGHCYWSCVQENYPNKKNIEDALYEQWKIKAHNHIVILNIIEFKNKKDWQEFNYKK